jgi:glycerophosphoryl diester phosphodiesterase
MTQAATERLPLRDRLEQGRGRVWVCGHRGAMGHCPENTMASFERGLALGADWIELDVHLSQDDALIVIHDETLDRTTNGHGLVREHTLAELRTLDAGGGQRIPTLDEVLAWARERETIVDIEIKNAPIYYSGIEQRVVSTLDRFGMTEQAIVISFDHAAVGRVKQLEPRITTGVLYACRPLDGGVGLARAAQADAVLPFWAYVTREDVDTAHAAGLSVAPWATSNPAVMRELIACGVDAIGTNHPDVLRAVLDSVANSRRDGAVAKEPVGSEASDGESVRLARAAQPTDHGEPLVSEASAGESRSPSRAAPPAAKEQPLRSEASDGASRGPSKASAPTPEGQR